MTEKSISITGTAINHYKQHKEGGTRRKRKNCKKEDNDFDLDIPAPSSPSAPSARQEGGKRESGPSNTPSGPSLLNAGNFKAAQDLSTKLQSGGSLPPGTTPQNPKEMLSDSAHPPALAKSIENGTAIVPPASSVVSQVGGKIVLEPKKKQKGKLLLAPPSGSKAPLSGQSKRSTRSNQTRKIRIGFAGMNKRITRSKSIHRDSKEKSIQEIRTILENAKLVKPAKDGKSVPEDILRNIYKDYMLLRGKAL